jgi:hypothetical protein
MMVKMRAKMKVVAVDRQDGFENLLFSAVCKSEGYPEDGSDENNTFARWTPTAYLSMTINNPELFGSINDGEEYYLDFIRAE